MDQAAGDVPFRVAHQRDAIYHSGTLISANDQKTGNDEF
jgi:hypothetical protein